MKLLFVNPASTDNLAAYDKGILDNLSDAEVIYVCNTATEYINEYKYPVHCIPLFSYDSHNNKIVRGLSYLFSLIRLLLLTIKSKPTIVHIQWPKVLVLDKLFLSYLNYAKIPVVFTAHNLLPHSDITETLLSSYKKYYKKTNAIIVHTQDTKEELNQKFGVPEDSIFVNKHGILPSLCDEKEVMRFQSHFVKELSLKDKIVFSSLGFQSYYKGLDFIIDYWKNILSINNHVHLFIAGSCRYDRVYELKNIPNVTIIDRLLTKDELCAVSGLSSVILLPYIKISQSGILMTAINDNIPVLVSNVGGLPEPLELADIGWNMGDPSYENFEKTMSHIIKHPDEIEKKKNNQEGWNRVKESYDWNNIAKKTEDIYFATLKQK